MSEPSLAKLAQVDPVHLGDPAEAEEIRRDVLESAAPLDEIDPEALSLS